MENAGVSSFKPPYLPFKTFLGFIERLGEKPLPPKIDRSMMGTKSGGEQVNLIQAMKGFRLIHGDQAVAPLLGEFVAADDDRKKALVSRLVQAHYPEQMKVSEQNGTPELLDRSFEQSFAVTGDTRRKAVTFFLQAARYAGLDLSPHFPPTRMGSGTRPAGVRKATKRSKRVRKGIPPSRQPVGKPEVKTVPLGDAGSVTITVDVRWLELPDATFTKLRSLIRDLEALAVEPDEDDEGDIEDDQEAPS